MDYMGEEEDVRRYPRFLRRNGKAAAVLFFPVFASGPRKSLDEVFFFLCAISRTLHISKTK